MAIRSLPRNSHDIAVAALLDHNLSQKLGTQPDLAPRDLPRIIWEGIQSPNPMYPHETAILVHALRLLESGDGDLLKFIDRLAWSLDGDSLRCQLDDNAAVA
jgi:hypothetical protein